MYLADELVRRLSTLYGDQEWAFLPQVASGTGAGSGRTCDALALNCWPSRGMELHGFEIKTYAGDFRRELANPAKAEAVQQYCDRWFIVTPTDTLIQPSLLPPTWGLIVADEKPRVIVPAPKLNPLPFTRAFIAAVLRAAQREGGISPAEHKQALKVRWDEAYKAGARAATSDHGTLDRVRWQRESLLELEKQADRVLKQIRIHLSDVKKMDPDGPVPASVPEDVLAERPS